MKMNLIQGALAILIAIGLLVLVTYFGGFHPLVGG